MCFSLMHVTQLNSERNVQKQIQKIVVINTQISLIVHGRKLFGLGLINYLILQLTILILITIIVHNTDYLY